MNGRYQTIKIVTVGSSSDPLCKKVGRGVFNIESLLDYLSHPVDHNVHEVTIDLSRVGWITLFDWWTFTCILHGQTANRPNLRFLLDFLGDKLNELIPYRDCAGYLSGRIISPLFSRNYYEDSYAVHRVLNFVKSLEGASGFENVARGQIALARVSMTEAGRPGWYRKDPDIENSVILPRTNVEAKEMCLQFANRSQIELWQEAMALKRVPRAAIFQSSEFWRVLCHELARNVFEHAKGPGFITGRVVLPVEGSMPHWCHDVYDSAALQQLGSAKDHGLVELCVSDAGVGIPQTIEPSYRNRYRERHGEDFQSDKVSHDALLKFAFDELGTSKDADRSWITERHALGHMLFIIGKYGGVLSVRSGNSELTYCADAGKFTRCTTQLGFEPYASHALNPAIRGTHLQLLIPLTPQSVSDTPVQSSTYLPLPQSFHVDRLHPVGPLVPVRDKLGVLSMSFEGDGTFKFKEATRALADELLRGSHPRSQLLVFDFSEVDWVPAQFETFLYLMQNVFLNRLVLFTQVAPEFAEIVNSQEDEDSPTYIPEAMKEDIQKHTLDPEFTGGKFLETYSALGALVLALGPDRGEYIFGVRSRELRAALLELINNEHQTMQGLADAHMLDINILQAVLHRASRLFRTDDYQRWGTIFVRGAPDRDDLEVQRLRAITEHFDIVAENCGAWRGRRSGRTASVVNRSDERFYLPSENAIYTEFFETSRILARERYVVEVAERLLYRICCGLAILHAHDLTLHDIDILACSTTPTVMLAEALRRAWPVGNKRPVVIDYGPCLFSGADPAHISGAGQKKLRAIIVHDLFDEGTLSKRLITMSEKQGIDVLFVLSFIQFLDPADCMVNKSKTFPPTAGWGEVHPAIRKPVHAMIGLRRPAKMARNSVQDWGVGDSSNDYVVDPRSLRPVPLPSLRLESGYSEERSLTKRDPYLQEFDMDGGLCRLAAEHFVYGNRHFAVVVDIRGVLTGSIGNKIINWLADLCCDKNRDVRWEKEGQFPLRGEVSAILLPLHSQIHYMLPKLQMELAQRERRVPHFFLDATSFGGGVEQYDVPYQLQHQIERAASAVKLVVDRQGTNDEVTAKQLRLLLMDDAIFSGRTMQTVLDSLSKHVSRTIENIYGKEGKYPGPIEWIRAFAILNQLPAARSALWHQLSACSASHKFRFDEYAPFVGVATFSNTDCPACRESEQLDILTRRVGEVGLTHVLEWIRERKEVLSSLTTEAPSLGKTPSRPLPEPIDVLALPAGGASERYKPIHTDSAIWRFYELVYLSYPLGDVLMCLKTTRKSGIANPDFRDEYARFRLSVYAWCVQNWHQVSLYHAEDQVIEELKAEVLGDESIFVEVASWISGIIHYEAVSNFVKWFIDNLAEKDADRKREATSTTLNMDTALTLLFLALHHRTDVETTELFEYLREKQLLMVRKSNFLSILYLHLTRPRMADPGWAITTIAETCFRGRFGNTAEARRTTDHELLGRIVSETARNPGDKELRRRLEGSLHNFIAAVENLQPFYDDDLLSDVVCAARTVCAWLRLSLSEALDNTTPLVELNNRMQDKLSWERFQRECHVSASEFKDRIEERLKELRRASKAEMEDIVKKSEDAKQHHGEIKSVYDQIELEVEVKPEVYEWCLMTHIPRLIACLSNIALEPAKQIIPAGPSRIVIKPCVPQRPQFLTIEVLTRFGDAFTAHSTVTKKSAKIGHSFDELRLFGITVDEPRPDPDFPSDGLRFSLTVPVGFQR